MFQLLKSLLETLTKIFNQEANAPTKIRIIKDEVKAMTKRKDYKILWNFLEAVEGFETKGYVPKEENEDRNAVMSGVTIASGFDLGQHDVNYLLKIELSPRLIEKLMPYMGLQGKEAKEMLEDVPLVLTEEEAREINKKVKHEKALKLVRRFNADSKLDFCNLDEKVQTVIMSVAFQYGNLRTRTPRFWKRVINGRWIDAKYELQNFGDSFPTRRNKEAKLLLEFIRTQ